MKNSANLLDLLRLSFSTSHGVAIMWLVEYLFQFFFFFSKANNFAASGWLCPRPFSHPEYRPNAERPLPGTITKSKEIVSDADLSSIFHLTLLCFSAFTVHCGQSQGRHVQQCECVIQVTNYTWPVWHGPCPLLDSYLVDLHFIQD